MAENIEAEVAAVAALDVVPTILDVACRITGMGFAAVARVTEDRWIACAVRDEIGFGLQPGGELEVATTICHEVRACQRPIVIDEVGAHEVYRAHPTPEIYGFESYISVPIVRADGSFFGTLCALDPRPADLGRPETLAMFKLFAQLVAHHLDARDRLDASERALSSERETGDLREQFIAVLGHDLRNPLAAVASGVRLLRHEPQTEKAASYLGLVQNSVARMAGLVDNVLDFARGRLGAGLELDRAGGPAPLGPVLEQVMAELRAAWPDRAIEARIELDRGVDCDPGRIAQLFSNLLANALTHGDPAAPVRVGAATRDGRFELSVANEGEPISPAMQERLFQPFFRATVRPSQQGLGLGLYIASEIARAHGGRLDVSSTPGETRFTFRMPLAAAA